MVSIPTAVATATVAAVLLTSVVLPEPSRPQPAAATIAPEDVPSGNVELRDSLLTRLEQAERTDPRSLVALSVSAGHVIAGAALEERAASPDAFGHLFLVGQGPWIGGASLPDGVYTVRPASSWTAVELVASDGQVAATIPLERPTQGSEAGPVTWTRIFRSILAALIP